jgi:lipopolysaccharide/colanic/teichoic acid biosynthesis glycosyltransferase
MYRKFGKRMMDATMAAVLLVLLSPVIALVALTIRLALGSPVLFRQRRPGKDEKLFTLLKFRTMSAATGTGLELDRISPLGRFLRSSSLDELPQLINVLRGEMSFTGPRPLLEEYLPLYSPFERQRHTVLPGITGLAQISGRNALSRAERFSLDVEYTRSISFLLDVKILLGTVAAVITRKGVVVAPTDSCRKLDEQERAEGAGTV